MTDHRTQLPPIWKKTLDPAIHLRVYRNGDGNFPGKVVTLNKRQQRTFDSWLRELSTSMKLRSGAVWRVFTPTQGHRVDDFERLEDGHMIVVAGQERFKPLRYAQIDPNPKKAPPKTYDVEPGHNRRYQVSGKYKKIDTHAKIIKCWANGNETSAPRTVLLPAHRNKPITLEQVIEQVSGVLCEECCGPVEKLYLPNGIKVMSLDQILPNAHYVALRKHDMFKRAHYKEVSLPNLRTSPRLERKSVLPPLSRSTKTSSHSSPEHSYSSQNGSENSYTQRYRRERARREEDQVFHARPVKHKRSSEKTRQVDYDQDNGGVFKAKSQNNATRGARPIEDSRQTRTELPVDKRPAEQVQDEDGDGSPPTDIRAAGDHQVPSEEEVKGQDKKDKKGKKEEGVGPPPPQQEQRTFRANSKQPNSPGNEQARREAEKEARARREAEDRERAEKSRQQREAAQQKKKEKEDKKKKEEEEKKRLAEEKKRDEEEKKRREEEERRWREEEEERKRVAAATTSTPDRSQDQNSERGGSPRFTPINNDRSGTEMLREEQRKLAEQEELAATKIQAGFRGYKTRKELKQKQAEEEFSRGRESMASLMRDDPIPLNGDDDWGPGPAADNHVEAEEKAAITLQAGFRGYKARQEVKEMRANQEVKDKGEETPPPPQQIPPARQQSPPSPVANDPALAKSATPTQTMANDISQAEAEHAAAAKIQATFRGHQTRKELAGAQTAGPEEVAGTKGSEQNSSTQH